MALEKGFIHIDFSRLRDLVNFPLPEKLEEITYVANATNFRRYLLNKYGKDDLDIDHEIATKPDTLMTYRGYRRFLESDLQHVFPAGNGRSVKAYKKNVKFLAKEMLIRGYVSIPHSCCYSPLRASSLCSNAKKMPRQFTNQIVLPQAFAGAVKSAFPDHLRLSIHQSTGEHKVSMSLLNTKTGFTTPWHCSVAMMADGEWISSPMGDFKDDSKFEVISEDGRPSYFKEKTVEAKEVENQ